MSYKPAYGHFSPCTMYYRLIYCSNRKGDQMNYFSLLFQIAICKHTLTTGDGTPSGGPSFVVTDCHKLVTFPALLMLVTLYW